MLRVHSNNDLLRKKEFNKYTFLLHCGNTSITQIISAIVSKIKKKEKLKFFPLFYETSQLNRQNN